MKRIALVIVFFTSLLVAWELLAQASRHLLFILPPPSSVAEAIWQRPDRFFFHTRVTVMEMLSGFLLAAGAALPTAYAMALWRPARSFLQPLFVFIQCLPMFTLAPLMVLLFGWGQIAIIVPTALMIFFPLTLTIYKGLRATPHAYLDFFRSNRATPWQTFRKLQLPWALPHLFSGLRIAAAIAGVGAVAGEWAGGQEGLGVFILESRRVADLESTFAAIACLTFVSLMIYFFIVTLEEFAQAPRPPLFSLRGALLGFQLLLFGGGLLSPQLEAEEKPTRLVLDWLPNPNHVPLYVGIEKGYFKDEGIELQVLKVHDPADGVPFLTSGMADIAIDYMPHAIRAFASGGEIRIIGTLFSQPLNSLIYRKEIDTLDGKTIGYATSTLNHLTLDYLLRKEKISFGDLKKVSFDLTSSLGAGLVDAFYGAYWNIEGVQLRCRGIETKHILVTDLGLPNYHELLFVAQAGSKESSSHFVQRFQRALQRSIYEAQKNPRDAFAAYLAANPDKGEQTRQWEFEAWLETMPLLSASQEISAEELQRFYDWLCQEGPAVGLYLQEVEISKLLAKPLEALQIETPLQQEKNVVLR